MQQSPVTQAVAPAAVSLVAFAVCVGAFLPPFVERTVSSVPITVLFGLAIAVSFVLHVAFVGIAAHRAGRSAALWAVLTVVFFPVGSIVGLVLFEWFSDGGGDLASPKSAPLPGR
jgi:hypothetical protein